MSANPKSLRERVAWALCLANETMTSQPRDDPREVYRRLADAAIEAMREESEPSYTEGGYIPGSPVPVYLDPDECLISLADVRAGRIRCSRAGHPTATSDCHAVAEEAS